MKIANDTPELGHVETTPQWQINQAFVEMLELRIRRQHRIILEAQMWLALGETHRAKQTLAQGISE